jgi:hypothetical protein
VRRELDRTQDALTATMGYEVEWTPAIEAILELLPEGASLTSISMRAAGPGQQPAANPNVLGSPSIGAITFAVYMPTLPDAAQWLDNLSAIPGFMDATYTSALLEAGAVGTSPETASGARYVVTSSVQLNIGALSWDFLAPAPDGAAAEPTSDGDEDPAGASPEEEEGA